MATEKSITEKGPPIFGREVKFRHLGGKLSGKEVAITRETFFIGRSANNNLVLDDRSVSRKHAVLNMLEGKFILSDLNSFKGTKVNGEKIAEIELRSGDRIRMGSVLLEFIDGNEPYVSHRKKLPFWPFLVVALAGVTFMIYLSVGNERPLPNQDMLRDIEYNYSQGIKAYNVDRDLDSARLYWKRVKELDPKGETQQGRKALKLLENLPSNNEASPGR